MASSTVEDYLKALYRLQQGAEGAVALGEVARAVGVTPGTATVMVRRLGERGLVHYASRSGATLTEAGEREALNVLRRHRLIELFLVEVVRLDWAEVHEEAEVLEHAVSDRLLERIDRMLGEPTHDPHGDPIPTAAGEIVRRPVLDLTDCPLGSATIARLGDNTPAFLRYAESQGLMPGASVEVTDRDAVADTVTLRVSGGEPVRLGTAAGRKIYVLANRASSASPTPTTPAASPSSPASPTRGS